MEHKVQVTIEEVKAFTPDALEAVRRMVRQLDDKFQPLTDDDFRFLVHSDNTHLYIARETGTNNIVGMITLIVYRIPYKMKAQLEDIVVDEPYRGQGIGTLLIQHVIEEAKELGVKSLNLTSNPLRESANRLYLRLGFEKRDTNIYRKELV